MLSLLARPRASRTAEQRTEPYLLSITHHSEILISPIIVVSAPRTEPPDQRNTIMKVCVEELLFNIRNK